MTGPFSMEASVRPVLKPALRRLWRDGSTVQLGVDPRHAVLLHEVTHDLLGALDLLDGTRRPEDVVTDAAAFGVGPQQARELLEQLLRGGALDDANAVSVTGGATERARLTPELTSLSLAHPAPGLAETLLARRAAAHVLIEGAGRVGAAIARLLAASGVGGVVVNDPRLVRPADVLPGGLDVASVGSPMAEAFRDLPAPPPGSRPDLVVLAPVGAAEMPLSVGDAWRRLEVPHLGARVRELTGIVGPLVLPGRTACLTCLHLHRTDRDPRWPLLAVQLSGPPRDQDPGAAALCALVAAAACLQVLEFLDAAPGPCQLATAGGTLELTPPDFRIRRRSWTPHPSCGCTDLPVPEHSQSGRGAAAVGATPSSLTG